MDRHQFEFERLRMLFEYTTFHIGLYAILITGLVAAREHMVPRAPDYLKWTLVAFLIAGAAGGVVASSIPDFGNYSVFLETRIGPFGWKLIPGQKWINLEHFAFWGGILWAGANAVLGAEKRRKESTGFGSPDKPSK